MSRASGSASGARSRKPVFDANSRSSTPENSVSLDEGMSLDDSIEVDELDMDGDADMEDIDVDEAVVQLPTEEPINLNLVLSFKNPNYKPPKKPRSMKQIVATERALPAPVNAVRYWSIDAPPSLKPQRKYCDMTGLEAKYTDPKTNLRYHSADCFLYIRKLSPAQQHQHLAMRNASTQIR